MSKYSRLVEQKMAAAAAIASDEAHTTPPSSASPSSTSALRTPTTASASVSATSTDARRGARRLVHRRQPLDTSASTRTDDAPNDVSDGTADVTHSGSPSDDAPPGWTESVSSSPSHETVLSSSPSPIATTTTPSSSLPSADSSAKERSTAVGAKEERSAPRGPDSSIGEEAQKQQQHEEEAEDSEEDDDEDDVELDDVNDELDGVAPRGRQLYSCDVCPYLVFTSPDALTEHAERFHSELFPDHATLHSVASKLVPVWGQVTERKADRITLWGRKMFDIARRRDAGPEKMSHAHKARAQLELVVQRWNPNAKVFIFGSSVTFGVWDGISDIDFAVVDLDLFEAGAWPPPEKNAVRSITELLRRAGFSYVNLEPIQHARVPIIKHHASSPIRITEWPTSRDPATCNDPANEDKERVTPSASSSSSSAAVTTASSQSSQLEAEAVIARSVRYVLNQPATPLDRVVLEGSVRDAVGAESVQQVWWNRTSEMMCLTCDTTTHAVAAATCALSFVTPTLRARVQPLHDECRPELYDVDFDLSFRAFGIRNSLLLRTYLLSHPCARAGALVLKDWSKTSGVNNSMGGYLTSYAVNILWIYYLVQKGEIPFVDPIDDIPRSLARDAAANGPAYCPIVPPIVDDALYHRAGSLLLGFFFYYACEFDWSRHVVSLNRRGITTKKALGWDVEDVVPSSSSSPSIAATASTLSIGNHNGNGGAASVSSASSSPRRGSTTRYSLCIEDPYEENLNLGRHMGITKTLRVQSEFYRGLLSLLKDGERESCVFAASDAADAKARAAAAPSLQSDAMPKGSLLATAATPSSSGPATPSSRSQLPLRVLYRLMAVAVSELAKARRMEAAAAHEASTETVLNEVSDDESKLDEPDTTVTHRGFGTQSAVVGVPEDVLRRAFETRATMEFQLACKAWNWQQLIHRLGYKLHRGHVFPRREVGVRRLGVGARPSPPPGVLPSVSAMGAFGDDEDGEEEEGDDGKRTQQSEEAERNQQQQHSSPVEAATVANGELLSREFARGGGGGSGMHSITEQMMRALADGFLRLTPEWVAWSTPWAALHLRGHRFFSASSPSPKASAVSPSLGSRGTNGSAAAAGAAFGSVSGGGGGGGGGGLRPTRRQAAPWRPLHGMNQLTQQMARRVFRK